MSIAEKLITIAQNEPKVYKAGQLSVLSSAESLQGEETGVVIAVNDVSPVEHSLGVKVGSKNLLQAPFANTPQTINGLTFTPNADGTVTLNGVNDGTSYSRYYYRFKNLTLPVGKYSIHSGVTDCKLTARIRKTGVADRYPSGATFDLNEGEWIYEIWLQIPQASTTVFDNVVVKPQLEIGVEVTTFTPHVSDLSAVKVGRYGKNLFNQANTEMGEQPTVGGAIYARPFENGKWYKAIALSGAYNTNSANNNQYEINGDSISVKTLGTTDSNTLYGLSMALECLPNTTYTLSYDMVNGKSKNASGIGFYGADKVWKSFKYCDSGVSFTTPEDCYWMNICFHGNLEETFVTYSNIQLEVGTTATEFEHYIEPQTATAKANGTVEGLTSIHPNMTLVTNTEGAVINLNYYKDIDLVVENLKTEIALSGGE